MHSLRVRFLPTYSRLTCGLPVMLVEEKKKKKTIGVVRARLLRRKYLRLDLRTVSGRIVDQWHTSKNCVLHEK